MLAGFYTAASGLLMQQRNVNVIGSNLTNSQTAGYRSERVISSSFEKEYLTRLEGGEYSKIGGAGDPAVLVDTVQTQFDTSSLEETNRPFDIALAGDGFFNIEGEENQFLTRNGNFNIDEDGYLILEGIGRVMGESGDLKVNGSDFTVTQQGYVFDNNGQYLDKLLITMPSENANIYKFKNGNFITDGAETVQGDLYQGKLERSNVDMNQEYSRLIEAQRALQACATALSTVDNMNAKAATLSSIA